MERPFTDVLPAEAMKICAGIGSSTVGPNYCLAGGTGLALQIKHRRSNDLDFILIDHKKKSLDPGLVSVLERIFPEVSLFVNLQESTQLDLTLAGIKITFLAYPFPLINLPVKGAALAPFLKGTLLASPQEIALMKAYSIGRRATFRDYIDLYFLLIEQAVDLAYIEEKAQVKYTTNSKSGFSMKLFLEQLVYTADLADQEAAIKMVFKEGLTVEAIENYLTGRVKEYLKSNFY
ncbi:MAG: nucleotidyl transferase AbiEii/AbiGii toxin family protein [Firmicutes bacterium]|nr:nucleotidyl transferase AbiEii/AbiGii toxin family protein [Bacillota bacterium]